MKKTLTLLFIGIFPMLNAQKTVDEYFEEANAKVIEKDYKGAMTIYENYVLKEIPKTHEDSLYIGSAYALMANIQLSNLKNYPKTLEYCNKAIIYDEEYQSQAEELRFTRGVANLYLKKYADCINDMDSTMTMGSAEVYKSIAIYLASGTQYGCKDLNWAIFVNYGSCNEVILKESGFDFIVELFNDFPEIKQKCNCNIGDEE